jgi:hypothetical protein
MEFVWPAGRGKNLQSAGVLNADGCVGTALKNGKKNNSNSVISKKVLKTVKIVISSEVEKSVLKFHRRQPIPRLD